MGDAGRIDIRTAHEGNEVVVRVDDDGVGIEAQRLEHIFELNFKTTVTRVRMGSGLAMAYRILQEHQGTIAIDSQIGKGTQVTIRLPIRQEKPLAAPA